MAEQRLGATPQQEGGGLVPGDYYIWCTLSDHAVLGMTGTLTIEP